MRQRFPIWLFLLLLVAFALRIYKLELQSIWWDEGISLHLATSNLLEIIADRLKNIHPPLYFWGLKSWLLMAGVNVFSARYFSVLASWLQVALIFAIVRRWFNVKTAYLAGIIAAISAVSVIYSQEIRVYALLPLVYLALLAVTRELTQESQSGKIKGYRLWLALGLISWFGLHLHYITIFVVIYVAAWALINFIKQKRWLDLRHWFLTQFLVLIASLPWFIAVIRNWNVVRGEANAGTFSTDLVPWRFLLMQVWTFHLSGLAGILSRSGVLPLTLVVMSLLIILLGIRIMHKTTRRNSITLLMHWLIPLSSALIVWTVRSFSHPRYVAIFVPGLIMLSAYLILPTAKIEEGERAWTVKLISGLLFLGILITSIWGLWLYFFDPDVAKDDMRGVARYLEDNANGDDLILVPDTDWSLPFEYTGEANIAMPGFDDVDGGWSNLEMLTENTGRLFVVDYLSGTRDWQGKLPFALNKAGTQTAKEEFDGLEVLTYEMKEPIAAPILSSNSINYEPLMLRGVWIEQDESAGDKIAVALKWELREPIGQGVNVSLRLQDEEDWLIAFDDTLLRDKYGRPTDQWDIDEKITTYHVIDVPSAIPPLNYELRLQAYLTNDDGIKQLEVLNEHGAHIRNESVIGTVNLVYRPNSETDVMDNLPITPHSEPLLRTPGLSLLAAQVEGEARVPGDHVTVQLLWQATEDSPDDVHPKIALIQGRNDLDVISNPPVNGRYPTNLWRSEEMVFERRRLKIPANVSGIIQVMLSLGNEKVVLGEIDVLPGQYNYEPVPVTYEIDETFGEIARLTGFNIAKEQFSNRESVPLELVWQSTSNGSERDLVVFTHILADDGRLIGQHDSRPANGSRNVNGWVVDEYVVDLHEMVLKENYTGQASIEVGLYNPETLNRELLADGSDHLILPIVLEFTVE